MKQILTQNGRDLILRGLSGETITFTKIKFGNGEEQDNAAVDLANPIMELPITSITKDDGYITLGASYKNADVPAEFSAHEIGVFAQDPDDTTQEILYCLWYEEDPVKADYISSVTDRILETKVEFHVFVDAVEDVTAILAGSTEYAPKSDLDDHVNNKENPHGVTKKHLGLENVPNVTPENQQPVFSEDVTAVTETDGVKSLPNISSKEKMGSILQKVRSVISAFISHLNSKNSHGLTPEDISAAKEMHYHSATDINKGTLSLLRGGTGATTAAQARKNLDVAQTEHSHTLKDITDALSADDIVNLYIWRKYENNPLYAETEVSNQALSVLFTGTYEIKYSSEITISDGTVSLSDAQTIKVTGPDDATIDIIRGKYVEYAYTIYLIPDDSHFTVGGEGTLSTLITSTAGKITANAEIGTLLSYVSSKANDTYPDKGEHTDGYWYEYHKQLGE